MCDHCIECRVSSMDGNVNCVRCEGEGVGSGSSTAHTTTTDLTNADGLEDCYEKVNKNKIYKFLKKVTTAENVDLNQNLLLLLLSFKFHPLNHAINSY